MSLRSAIPYRQFLLLKTAVVGKQAVSLNGLLLQFPHIVSLFFLKLDCLDGSLPKSLGSLPQKYVLATFYIKFHLQKNQPQCAG